MDPRLEEMIPAPAGVERNIRNAVASERLPVSINAIDYTSIFQKEFNAI